MRKLIVIGGLPATGKTTLMRKFLEGRTLHQMKYKKLLDFMYDSAANLAILGKYEDGEVFAGTDRLSMAVQPEAVEFIQDYPQNILLEGDRLFTMSFLEECARLADEGKLEFHILILNADKHKIEERHVSRNDNQSDQFKRSRDTKIDNIRSNFTLMSYITEKDHNDEHDTNMILTTLNILLEN
jgi:adenylate kinase